MLERFGLTTLKIHTLRRALRDGAVCFVIFARRDSHAIMVRVAIPLADPLKLGFESAWQHPWEPYP